MNKSLRKLFLAVSCLLVTLKLKCHLIITFVVVALIWMPLRVAGGESFFFVKEPGPAAAVTRVEGDHMIVMIAIKRLEPPKASAILAFHQGLGPNRAYQIQIELVETPDEDWLPMLKLGDDVVESGIYLSRPKEKRFKSTFHIESDDPVKIRRWCHLLAQILNVTDDNIQIELD